MICFKQALTTAGECVARLVPTRNTPRATTRADFYLRSPHSIDSVYSPNYSQDAAVTLALASSETTLDTGQHTTSIPLATLHKVPATLTVTTDAAHVCKFSHGSGLLVYINGALISAAHVALQVNIATLWFVKRLPLDELGAIGVCLGTAFASDESRLDITWAEVDDETEQDWREAEREWEPFPGGPYEAFELEEYNEEPLLRRPIRRVECGEHGPVGAGKWAVFSKRRLPVPGNDSVSLRPNIGAPSSSSQHPKTADASSAVDTGTQAPPVMTDAEFNALPDYSDSFSYFSSSSEDQDAIELRAIKRPRTLHGSISDPSLDKENALLLWSPDKGDGPIISSDEFDALLEWSDGEDDPDWNSAVGDLSELNQLVELEDVMQEGIW